MRPQNEYEQVGGPCGRIGPRRKTRFSQPTMLVYSLTPFPLRLSGIKGLVVTRR
jgi:hypothetical protein